MDKALTVIKKSQCLPFYPITVLPPDVLELMQRSFDALLGNSISIKMGNLIKVFDVYCHVTATPITYLSLSSPTFERVIRGFLGAFDNDSLVSVEKNTRRSYAKSFTKLLTKMREEIPLLPVVLGKDALPESNRHIWEGMKAHLDPVALRYWNGWEVQGRKENNGYVPMAYLWNSHGPEFAELVFDEYSKNMSKKLAPSHTDFNTLIYYLSENKERWPVSTFQNPLQIKRLFIDFMFHNFMQAVENGTDIDNRTRTYSKFIFSIDEIFIQSGTWARPFAGSLPKPPAKSTPGARTNHKKNSDGTVVKNKLITEVPLHLTDSTAIKILFKNIHEDNTLVLKWARYRLTRAKEAYEACKELAKYGTVITGGNENAKKIEDIGAANICATYVEKGTTYLKKGDKELTGKIPKGDIFKILGIPTVDTIFAFQMLLVHAHPCITDSFFLHFELHNKRGDVSGFKATEYGYQLIGYKDRKKGQNSEQKIDLSEQESEWVKLIIAMTEALRNDLRAAGNDEWRYLFLHTAGRLITPSRPESLKLNDGTIIFQKRMVEEFMVFGNRDETATRRFITQLSVTAFRASAAVEIYLRDHDVEEMARALGHKGYTSTLLSSYLPEPILAFFQTRWIRLFQRGIICRAMKDSPRLLEAARFRDMDELHEFLKNHALREIPEHLQNPDYLKTPVQKAAADNSDPDKPGQVVVSIDTGVLTALLSLNAAVAEATENARSNNKSGEDNDTRQLCSKAIYWSHFSDLVVKEIEDGFNSELQEYLETAQQHANAAHMEDLIYATAS
ncbi:hypothetical protein V2K98_11430 [Pseudomonas alliivorans]|nr:hypothetical protein [Pseudomonas alliivorans]MEE4649330.1 hypothetical protein [Pseudomonas alliivorans]